MTPRFYNIKTDLYDLLWDETHNFPKDYQQSNEYWLEVLENWGFDIIGNGDNTNE